MTPIKPYMHRFIDSNGKINMGAYLIAHNRYRMLKKRQINASIATMSRQQLKQQKKLNKIYVYIYMKYITCALILPKPHHGNINAYTQLDNRSMEKFYY